MVSCRSLFNRNGLVADQSVTAMASYGQLWSVTANAGILYCSTVRLFLEDCCHESLHVFWTKKAKCPVSQIRIQNPYSNLEYSTLYLFFSKHVCISNVLNLSPRATCLERQNFDGHLDDLSRQFLLYWLCWAVIKCQFMWNSIYIMYIYLVHVYYCFQNKVTW